MASDFKWDIGVATLTTKDADGFIGVQVDVYGDQGSATDAPSAPPFEAFMPPGLYCRPRDPDTGPDGTTKLGANVLYAWEGNTGYAFPMHDPRVIAKLPNTIAPGDTVLYCDRDDGQVSIMRLAAKDGAFIAYCPAPGGNGQGVQLRLDPVNGLDLFTPWGRMLLGPLGFHVTLPDSQLNMGGIGGLPGPFAALGAYANLQSTGVVSLSGGAVSQGTDGGLANEQAVTALIGFITTLVAAIGTITTASPGATAMSTITPLLASLPVLLAPIGKTV